MTEIASGITSQEVGVAQGAQSLKNSGTDTFEESPAKRIKLAQPEVDGVAPRENNGGERRKGTAPIKQE